MKKTVKQKFWWVLGWIFVRPRRWLFWNMMWASEVRWLPEKDDYFGWRYPNFHWHFLYRTIFRFFKWLYWDGWRPLAVWEDGYRKRMPWYADFVHKIGQTTAGVTISGGECFHCAFDEGDPIYLSEEGSEYFELTDSGVSYTMDGDDHWFRGITTCPVCGFQQEYGDS